MKESESGTLDTVHLIQQTIGALHKVIVVYYSFKNLLPVCFQVAGDSDNSHDK